MRWLVVAALLFACKGKQAPPKRDDARARPIDAAVADAAIDAAPPPDAGMSTSITPDGVGPIGPKFINIDDYKEAFPELSIKQNHREGEDFMFDEFVASKGKTKILRAVVNDRTLFKIEVFDPMFSTAAGVTTGMTVADAAAKMKDLKCVFETYDPEADAERVEKSLRCESASLPQVIFEIDLDGFKGSEGTVGTKMIASRKIVQILWLASHD